MAGKPERGGVKIVRFFWDAYLLNQVDAGAFFNVVSAIVLRLKHAEEGFDIGRGYLQEWGDIVANLCLLIATPFTPSINLPPINYILAYRNHVKMKYNYQNGKHNLFIEWPASNRQWATD